MKTLAIGEFKTHFSSVLADLKTGHAVTVTQGKSRTKVAVLLPYDQYRKSPGRKLGILESRGRCKPGRDFAVSDEEFLNS